MRVARDVTVCSHVSLAVDYGTFRRPADRRAHPLGSCWSSLVRSNGRRPASDEKPRRAVILRSPYQRHGSRVRLYVSGKISSSPVRTADGRHMVSYRWSGIHAAGTTASSFGGRASGLCTVVIQAGRPYWKGPGLARAVQPPVVPVLDNMSATISYGPVD
ncbi:hypothetical protein DPMN_049859 [Dreissena polymorpha]|uniref:Uncharacterized protein n=1 Tax=Dreissena polymorpha TaxID=45954 RepID=A0A9D4CGG8_DREPO|nr:hypothetical protein DPMN_049859 [Dreissena polymorpha]